MALEDEVLSGDLFLKLSSDGGTTHDTVGVMNNVQLTYSFPTIDVSSQGSGGYQKLKPGKRKALSGTCSGKMRFTNATDEANADDVFTLADDGTQISFTYGATSPSGEDVTYSGSCLITNLQIGGADDGEATYSFQFDSTGTFTIATA